MSVLQLPKLPGAAGKQHWGNLPGAALSLAIAEAASAAKRFTLLLTADSQSAERLQEELAFFAPDLPVLHFPDWETLPYDVFSPHQDIISQRIATLYRLPEIKHGVLVRTQLVKTDGETIAINYFQHDNEPTWQIRDIYVAGAISELATRRSQVTAILRSQGVDGLVAALNKKADAFSG